ncbi:MAG TPA: hypothetical protein VND22_08340 [Actinomycetota bacterium]|nr:hypothetical protein [Actinomycetota bacterium]
MRLGRAAGAMLIALTVWGGPALQTDVTVAGTVVNGTSGSHSPVGAEVTIAQLSPSGDEVARAASIIGADGGFSAGPFDGARGERFIAVVQHSGVAYSAQSDAAGGIADLQLTVFDTTNDVSVVAVESDTLTLVGGSQGNVDALQVMRIRNSADRTYIGESTAASFVVKFPAAEGALGITAEEGLDPERLVALPDGIGSGLPLHPGLTSFSYVYRIKSLRAGVTFSRPVVYPTEKAHLLSGPGLSISSEGFEFVESKPLGGRLYRRYTSTKKLAAGGTISVNVRPARAADDLKTPVAISAGVIVGLALIVPLVRKRMRKGVPLSERERLIQRIAKLDEDHATGKLNEQRYREVRAELKADLLSISGAADEFDGE